MSIASLEKTFLNMKKNLSLLLLAYSNIYAFAKPVLRISNLIYCKHYKNLCSSETRAEKELTPFRILN